MRKVETMVVLSLAVFTGLPSHGDSAPQVQPIDQEHQKLLSDAEFAYLTKLVPLIAQSREFKDGNQSTIKPGGNNLVERFVQFKKAIAEYKVARQTNHGLLDATALMNPDLKYVLRKTTCSLEGPRNRAASVRRYLDELVGPDYRKSIEVKLLPDATLLEADRERSDLQGSCG